MIHTRKELKRYIHIDNEEYFRLTRKERLIGKIARYPNYEIMRYKVALRKAEYWMRTTKLGKMGFLCGLLYERKKNCIGKKLGIEIEVDCFEPGLQIYHSAGIVVNPKARIGKNCKLHGANCIGNNGKTQEVPMVGNNVDIGFGACIIGGVRIADNVTIGSNAVVVNDCLHEGAILVGSPAREVSK